MNPLQLRLQSVRKAMVEKELDGLLIIVGENRRYLSGFTAEDHQYDEISAVLLISGGEQVLVTDSRFELQAKAEAPDWEVVIYHQSLTREIVSLCSRLGLVQLGYESKRLSVHSLKEFETELSQQHPDARLIPFTELIEQLRWIKDAREIQLTRQALSLAETAFRQVIHHLQPGMTEKDVAWHMEQRLREVGADALSFPVIVASGPNSALPHAIPSDRKIMAGEPILIDWGCRLHGYCSDTTRTVVIGPPADPFLQVYRCVLEAQNRAIALIKTGVSTKVVDSAARDFISSQGYGDNFGHGLGHGTGLAVHEAPRLSPIREDILQSGMIVTVEPGIYLPDWGGVRIEHQVVVQTNGADVMNGLSTTYDITRI